MSPYFGKTFLTFFPLFFSRMFSFLTGSLKGSELASDEIQFLVLAAVSIASALIGTLLVLKKMTMVANSLSHTILVGIVVAYLVLAAKGSGQIALNMPVLLIAALATGIVTTLLTQFVHRVMRLQEDASIGLVFTSLFALGVLLVTLYTRNAHIGLEIVMGNADALHLHDLKLVSIIASVNILALLLFYKEWKLLTFDEGLARAMGLRPFLFNTLLMLLTSATAISAFRAVGVLLFLAFLVGLPLIARTLSDQFGGVLLWSGGVGVFLSLFAVAISRHMLSVYQMPLSTAGITVTLIGIVYAAVSLTFLKIRA